MENSLVKWICTRYKFVYRMFVNKYNNVPAPFGFSDAGSNSLGEITFIRTYSRVKEDGTKERWHEVCRRVIEGMYSVQKNHG